MSDTAARPRVSAILATSRGGPFLHEALASLVSQTYPNIHAVVVDDGAPDPAAIASAVARFPGVSLVRQRNAGSSVARNAGVAHSEGELLAFLDDDDRWHPERIARQVEAMIANPSAVLSYCGMRTIDDEGRELVPGDQVQVRDIHDIVRRRTGIILPNLMVRRETFLRVGGFHPAFRRAQDLDLVLKVAMEGDFVFVPETLVDYRYHAGNNTRVHRELARSIDQVIRLHRWAARERGRTDLLPDYAASLAANGRFAMWTVARAARDLVRRRRYAAAVGELAWAVGFAPTAPLSWLQRRLPTRRG